MTLEQWASLAEVVGVIGLITSLVYVGQQVRLNRDQLRADAASRMAERTQELWSGAALDRDFAEVWHKGAVDLDALDEVDRERVINWEIGVIYLLGHWYTQHRQGLMPAHILRTYEWTLTGVGQRQAFREAWRVSKDNFDDSFQQYLGNYIN